LRQQRRGRPNRLLLSGLASSGARATPDGAAIPGRNRIHLVLTDLDAEIWWVMLNTLVEVRVSVLSSSCRSANVSDGGMRTRDTRGESLTDPGLAVALRFAVVGGLGIGKEGRSAYRPQAGG
jgi:hypothetical protein